MGKKKKRNSMNQPTYDPKKHKVIRIDSELWEHIKKNAEPLVDTPCKVLKRLLKLS